MLTAVQTFFTEHFSVFTNLLRSLVYVLMFEQNKNVWIFAKAFHGALVLCSMQENLEQLISEVVTSNEKDPERQGKMLKELGALVQNAPLNSLDNKARDCFQTKFNVFKSFIYDINN